MAQRRWVFCVCPDHFGLHSLLSRGLCLSLTGLMAATVHINVLALRDFPALTAVVSCECWEGQHSSGGLCQQAGGLGLTSPLQDSRKAKAVGSPPFLLPRGCAHATEYRSSHHVGGGGVEAPPAGG